MFSFIDNKVPVVYTIVHVSNINYYHDIITDGIRQFLRIGTSREQVN